MARRSLLHKLSMSLGIVFLTLVAALVVLTLFLSGWSVVFLVVIAVIVLILLGAYLFPPTRALPKFKDPKDDRAR